MPIGIIRQKHLIFIQKMPNSLKYTIHIRFDSCMMYLKIKSIEIVVFKIISLYLNR